MSRVTSKVNVVEKCGNHGGNVPEKIMNTMFSKTRGDRGIKTGTMRLACSTKLLACSACAGDYEDPDVTAELDEEQSCERDANQILDRSSTSEPGNISERPSTKWFSEPADQGDKR